MLIYFQINMEHAIQNQMQEVISKVEQHVDAEIEKLEKFDVDDFEKLRERRLANMKKEAKLKQEFLAMVIINHRAVVLEYPLTNYLFVGSWRVPRNG
jgi:hypothetical protein